MSLLSDDLLLGDFMFPFNQSFMEADEGLGLLDDCIEVSGYLPSHGFSIEKAKNGVSEPLPLFETFGIYKGDAFSGMDWMVEKMDLKVFDFDSLLGMEDLESTISPDELMATLDDSCDLLEDPPLPSLIGQYVPSFTPDSLPESPLEADQVAPVSPSLKSSLSSPDHSFILDVGSEVDVAVEDKKLSVISDLEIPKYEQEESLDNDSSIFMNPLLKSEKEDSSDNDSGICMSPSDLGSPQQSPTFTVEYPSSVQSSPNSPTSKRPKPYDLPKDKAVLAKVKSVGQPRVDKKHKKMEQNKTAATRYRPSPAPVSLPESPLEADQVAPVSPSLVEYNISSPDHSFILDVGSEVDVAEEDKKISVIYTLEVLKCEKEESSDNDSGIYMNPLLKSEKEDSSDNDSGICMSPSYLGSPQQSPTFTVEYPNSVQSSPDSPNSERPKPYDLPSKDKEVLAKVKSVGQPRVDKKKKKMEQNKTAATRYRQKKKAEQEVISAECRELEQKNDSLQEKVDSLAKEIQYLKDLLEEVRKAKSKRAKSS